MFFNIQTKNGPMTKEGEYVEMHGIGLMFCPVPGGFAVSHYATGLALEPLDAIAEKQAPVGLQEAKDGAASMFEAHPELRAKIVQKASTIPVINVLPQKR